MRRNVTIILVSGRKEFRKGFAVYASRPAPQDKEKNDYPINDPDYLPFRCEMAMKSPIASEVWFSVFGKRRRWVGRGGKRRPEGIPKKWGAGKRSKGFREK